MFAQGGRGGPRDLARTAGRWPSDAAARLIAETALFGTASLSATVTGSTLTVTASLLPGSATGGGALDASVIGQTLTVTASLTAGAVAASSSVAGQTLAATLSIASIGAVTASSQMAGQTIAATLTILPGSASTASDASISGQTLTTTVFFFAGLADNGAATGPQDRARKIFPRKFK